MLCGCGSLEDITAWVSSAGPEVMAALGRRRNALGVLTPPHPDTIVRVFTGLGAQRWPITPAPAWTAAPCGPAAG